MGGGLHDDHAEGERFPGRRATRRVTAADPDPAAEAGGPRACATRWRGARRVAKRALDLGLAVIGLVVLAPVLAMVSAVILVADGSPVLFRQTRVGLGGRPFTMLKFRTMVPDAEARLDDVAHQNERHGPLFKAGDDPRVTRVGRVLRHTSLDELPQLWNVLVGTMSLVGPRPALYPEREQFPAELLARESMPPGISGLWQLDGRTDPDFGKYTELDLRYVAEWSLWLDLTILVRTPVVVVRHGWSELRRVSARVVHHSTPDPAGPSTGTVVTLPVEPRGHSAEAAGAA